MKVRVLVSVAVRSLRRTPTRSGLTSLGVVIGVAAVVVTASIGNGAQARIQEALEQPETRVIQLNAFARPNSVGRASQLPPPRDRLQTDDYEALRTSINGLSAVTPRIYLPSIRVHAGAQTVEATLIGIDVGGFEILTIRQLQGELFSGLDVTIAANVCVLSESLSRLLFRERPSIGRTLLVKGAAFTVLGVIHDAPRPESDNIFGTVDLRIYVPFTSLLRRVDAVAPLSISVQALDVDGVAGIQAAINDLMEERRHNRKAIFLTSNATDFLRSYADGSRTVAHLLAALGAVALLVGGVGIMNIMVVNITDRTREIGIRTALGTRRREVLFQFLIEAAILSALGGLAGVIIGVAGARAITYANDWPTRITWTSILGAFCCSAAVGILFGYGPAKRAAELEPVRALRVE